MGRARPAHAHAEAHHAHAGGTTDVWRVGPTVEQQVEVSQVELLLAQQVVVHQTLPTRALV